MQTSGSQQNQPLPRIFESDFLEKFTRIHPVVPILFWAPIVSYMIYRGFAVYNLSFLTMSLLALSAIFTWTFTEYVMHRYLFHFVAGPNWPFIKRLVYSFHGVHHDAPNDRGRLVMPPTVALPLGTAFYFLFSLFLGFQLAVPFTAFFVIGYLSYDYIHFYTHHAKPTTRLGKYLKQAHMVHHYSSPNSRWGVSTPLWDIVFGTLDEAPVVAPTPSKQGASHWNSPTTSQAPSQEGHQAV